MQIANQTSGGTDTIPSPRYKHTVLVVDDDMDIAEVIGFILQSMQINVIQAGDRSHALNILQRRQVDLILLDLCMPGMSAETFVERVRDLSAAPEIVLISADNHGRQKVRDLNLYYFIAKPFDLNILQTIVHRALALSVD